MQTELSITAFERKLEKVYNWAFFKRYSEGYVTGVKEAVISLKRTIDPSILAKQLEISVADVLNIWEQS